jgi:hypothetical protein
MESEGRAMQKHMKDRELFDDSFERGELPEEGGYTLFLHADSLVRGPYDFPLKSRQISLISMSRKKVKQLGIYIERV